MKDELDEICKSIFSVFLVTDEELRFNELHRTLGMIGLKMSKPTLSEHLKHLRRKKLVVRRKEGKQNVSYKTNWKELESLDKAIKTQQALKRTLENEAGFKSFPIDEQVTYVHNVLALRNLYRLKLEVLNVIDPNKNFEHSVQYLFIHRFFELFKTWLLQTCHESNSEGRKAALDMIEHNIKHYEDTLFDKKPLKTAQES